MKLLDLRVAWRQLIAEPLNSTVLIVGLGLALAACYLLAVLVGERRESDPHIRDPQRVVLIDFHGNMPGRQEDWFLLSPFAMYDALRTAGDPLQDMTRTVQTTIWLRQGETQVRADALAADPSYAALFTPTVLRGDLAATLARPDGIALAAPLARQLFGAGEALGQVVYIGHQLMKVGAVLEVQDSRHPDQVQAWVGFDSPAAGLADEARHAWFWMEGRLYGRLRPGVSAESVSALAQTLLDHSPFVAKELPREWTEGGRKAAFMRALPLPEMGFEGQGGKLRRQVLGALSVASLLLLGLALLNFINLSGVRTLRREREIAIRKSLGLSPTRLLWMFLTESALSVGVAMLLAVLLAWMVAPKLAAILQLPAPTSLLHPRPLLLLLAACALLTAIVCLHPAWLAWRQRCAPALQGRQASEGQGGRWMRRTLSVLQFGMALAVCALALVLSLQNRHALHRDRGFNAQGLMAVQLPEAASAPQAEDLQRAVAALPGVKGTAWTDSLPATGRLSRDGGVARADKPDAPVTLRLVRVDPGFFSLYQISLVAGQLHAGDPEQAVIDEAALKAFGWQQPLQAVGTLATKPSVASATPETIRIAAVSRALNLESTRETARPHGIQVTDIAYGLSHGARWFLNFRLAPGTDADALLRPVWKRLFPTEPLQIESVEAAMAEPYAIDLSLARLVGAASVLALLLAGFGVYAMSAHLVQRHARELVLRKLHGASPLQMLSRLTREFGALLSTAALLALPLSWWLAQLYLAQYADAASIGWWPQVLALAGLLLIMLLSALRHGLTAMAMRPIEALRG